MNNPIITSANNPKIQHVREILRKKKSRIAEQVYVAEGVRLVEEAVKNEILPKILLYSDAISDRGYEIIKYLQNIEVPIFQVADHLLARISDTKTSQGVIAVLSMEAKPFPATPSFLLIVDRVRDPGNMGTLLRTARAAGVDGVMVLDGSVDVYSPKVVRAGMGAHFSLMIQMITAEELISNFDELHLNRPRVFAMVVIKGKPIWVSDFRQPCALVVGGEAGGVSGEMLEICDERITIPMKDDTESLNAGIAGSVALFEVFRQRWQQ
ncbi:MAG: RNA methyltransferase [Anaerolineaceae bacterium]|nr:RNA methyltransferase [Anaerolineaceae bacterium]